MMDWPTTLSAKSPERPPILDARLKLKAKCSMKKADHLFYRAQALAAERPYFFEIKGPSVGNHDTAAFMKELRSHAEHHLLARPEHS